MLASGILTIIQITRIKLCGGYYLGAGLISVMGTSSVPPDRRGGQQPGATLGRAIGGLAARAPLISISSRSSRRASHFPPPAPQAIIDNDIFSPDGSGLAGYGKFIDVPSAPSRDHPLVRAAGHPQEALPADCHRHDGLLHRRRADGHRPQVLGRRRLLRAEHAVAPDGGGDEQQPIVMGPQSCQGDNGGEG